MSDLEKKLFENIQKKTLNCKLKELKKENIDLTKKYRNKKFARFSSDLQRLAYLSSRMMPTYKALKYCLKELNNLAPELKINSFLDLGSGPLTSFWAIMSIFDSLKDLHFVEKDKNILNFGKEILNELLQEKEKILNTNIIIENNNLLKIKNFDFDVTILSYVVNELKYPLIEKILNRWFFSKSKVLVVVEPGTKYGFKNINFIRESLIKKGCYILAPCPNEKKCPMQKNDWCHFYVRVKRSKSHKFLKKGSLGYEDEKFSYLIVTKKSFVRPNARVLRFPKKSSKEIYLTLCTDGKIIEEKFLKNSSKKDKLSKKINWGDSIDV